MSVGTVHFENCADGVSNGREGVRSEIVSRDQAMSGDGEVEWNG